MKDLLKNVVSFSTGYGLEKNALSQSRFYHVNLSVMSVISKRNVNVDTGDDQQEGYYSLVTVLGPLITPIFLSFP